MLAGGKNFTPEDILFELHIHRLGTFPQMPLSFEKSGKQFEVFREYTDCLYSAYGTKWNGNAAAYNGSLFVTENDRLRRMTPLECERLMGFPDNYTDVSFATPTNRYQGVGNSWAVPVVRWIGERLFHSDTLPHLNISDRYLAIMPNHWQFGEVDYFGFNGEILHFDDGRAINTTCIPETIEPSNLANIIDTAAPEKVFISPVGCKGILRRAEERNMKMNPRLAEVMRSIASQLPDEEIERISRIQPRGAHSVRYQAMKSNRAADE